MKKIAHQEEELQRLAELEMTIAQQPQTAGDNEDLALYQLLFKELNSLPTTSADSVEDAVIDRLLARQWQRDGFRFVLIGGLLVIAILMITAAAAMIINLPQVRGFYQWAVGHAGIILFILLATGLIQLLDHLLGKRRNLKKFRAILVSSLPD